MLVLLCLVNVIVLPALALRGIGFRGLYLAVALSALAIGALVIMSTGPALSSDLATQAGADFLNEYGFAFAGWAFVTGFAATLAACLYRQARVR